jgi:hypothetical protein
MKKPPLHAPAGERLKARSRDNNPHRLNVRGRPSMHWTRDIIHRELSTANRTLKPYGRGILSGNKCRKKILKVDWNVPDPAAKEVHISSHLRLARGKALEMIL